MDKIVQPDDYKYFIEKPDSSFSPERNKAIIQETIKETEAYFKGIGKAINDNLGNRIEIFSTYATYRFNKGQKGFKDYVGKRLHSELIGEKILEKIKIAQSANKLGGNNTFIQL